MPPLEGVQDALPEGEQSSSDSIRLQPEEVV